ncbi:MAG: gamma carboxymuconolactone decarboxylase [Gammaproteobacteria bacterium]|nr:gamma carboxymuconolactone decarboxylase [Gammaproteobacteria bacterium]NIR82634.1 gamma carboxymuconolactone decarboxylase [Gammaproteobacteria bacterium]NIR89097.1 gamma carboxymuconolactone decarboxylase [Gammaproteobacteria bacterium]NIU03793.1 gamma carboxymuconolactone decarboxylase [Gammaproteobacteria bacterium]NIV51130.1 gamma carboxymuconolactone decarboxylase [Gammaproteobacteria bacterium]
MAKSELYEKGLAVRREVLGSEWVDPLIEEAQSDSFAAAIQDIVTEYCWGYGWTRPGLDRKTRSLLNLAILTSLGKVKELKAHTRGALRNGCTVEEIRETLIHATIYCGIPAGVDAFRSAREALEAEGG